MTVRRGLAVAAALAVVAGLGGCSGEPGASPPPSEPASSPGSASPSATDDAPTLPPEARGRDEESAKAFVGYFLSLIGYAERTGDVAPLRAASTPKCESCQGIARSVREIYTSGGRAESDGWSAGRIQVRSDDEYFFAGAKVRVGRQVTYEGDGSSKEFAGGRQQAAFRLVRLEGHWKMDTFTLVGE